MKDSQALWKTTIVIWSEYDPQSVDIDTLAHEAIYGDAYCSLSDSVYVTNPYEDEHAPSEEFFWSSEEEEDWTDEDDEPLSVYEDPITEHEDESQFDKGKDR